MLFNSIEYLFIFIPIVFSTYFFLNKLKFFQLAKIFLLFASLYFYGTYKIEYVLILLCSIIFNYFISKLFKFDIDTNKKRFILIFAIIINIAILIFFKYFYSLIEILNNLSFYHFNSLQIIIPLGISFFTLQQISYIIDCYNKNIKEYNILDYALFICFFPQLIAGPIVRHQEMIPQLKKPQNRNINQNNIFIGIFLITCGLLKKVIFADEFSEFISYVINNQIYSDFYISWFLCIAKVLNIYFDFSGYCDIALGSAALFNISLPWNFNSPFQTEDIKEFWKKNNMTLIRFLKDYIYRPLEKTKINIYTNILLMFSILGLWMGINFTSVIYGLLNGIYVCINAVWRKFNIKMPYNVARLITFISILFSAPFLFEDNIFFLNRIIKSMFGIDATYTKFIIQDYYLRFMLPPPHNAQISIVILVLAIITIFFLPNSNILARIYAKKNNTLYTILIAFIFLYIVISMTKTNSFIYFDF